MASFVEQATLRVKDESSAQIRKINSELKKLMTTARSLRAVNIRMDGLERAASQARALSAALRGIPRSVPINITGLSAGSGSMVSNVRAISDAINRLASHGPINIAIDITGAVQATNEVRALNAQLRALSRLRNQTVRITPPRPVRATQPVAGTQPAAVDAAVTEARQPRRPRTTQPSAVDEAVTEARQPRRPRAVRGAQTGTQAGAQQNVPAVRQAVAYTNPGRIIAYGAAFGIYGSVVFTVRSLIINAVNATLASQALTTTQAMTFGEAEAASINQFAFEALPQFEGISETVMRDLFTDLARSMMVNQPGLDVATDDFQRIALSVATAFEALTFLRPDRVEEDILGLNRLMDLTQISEDPERADELAKAFVDLVGAVGPTFQTTPFMNALAMSGMATTIDGEGLFRLGYTFNEIRRQTGGDIARLSDILNNVVGVSEEQQDMLTASGLRAEGGGAVNPELFYANPAAWLEMYVVPRLTASEEDGGYGIDVTDSNQAFLIDRALAEMGIFTAEANAVLSMIRGTTEAANARRNSLASEMTTQEASAKDLGASWRNLAAAADTLSSRALTPLFEYLAPAVDDFANSLEDFALEDGAEKGIPAMLAGLTGVLGAGYLGLRAVNWLNPMNANTGATLANTIALNANTLAVGAASVPGGTGVPGTGTPGAVVAPASAATTAAQRAAARQAATLQRAAQWRGYAGRAGIYGAIGLGAWALYDYSQTDAPDDPDAPPRPRFSLPTGIPLQTRPSEDAPFTLPGIVIAGEAQVTFEEVPAVSPDDWIALGNARQSPDSPFALPGMATAAAPAATEPEEIPATNSDRLSSALTGYTLGAVLGRYAVAPFVLPLTKLLTTLVNNNPLLTGATALLSPTAVGDGTAPPPDPEQSAEDAAAFAAREALRAIYTPLLDSFGRGDGLSSLDGRFPTGFYGMVKEFFAPNSYANEAAHELLLAGIDAFNIIAGIVKERNELAPEKMEDAYEDADRALREFSPPPEQASEPDPFALFSKDAADAVAEFFAPNSYANEATQELLQSGIDTFNAVAEFFAPHEPIDGKVEDILGVIGEAFAAGLKPHEVEMYEAMDRDRDGIRPPPAEGLESFVRGITDIFEPYSPENAYLQDFLGVVAESFDFSGIGEFFAPDSYANQDAHEILQAGMGAFNAVTAFFAPDSYANEAAHELLQAGIESFNILTAAFKGEEYIPAIPTDDRSAAIAEMRKGLEIPIDGPRLLGAIFNELTGYQPPERIPFDQVTVPDRIKMQEERAGQVSAVDDFVVFPTATQALLQVYTAQQSELMEKLELLAPIEQALAAMEGGDPTGHLQTIKDMRDQLAEVISLREQLLQTLQSPAATEDPSPETLSAAQTPPTVAAAIRDWIAESDMDALELAVEIDSLRQETLLDQLEGIQPMLSAIEAMGTEDKSGYIKLAAEIMAELAALEERQFARLEAMSPGSTDDVSIPPPLPMGPRTIAPPELSADEVMAEIDSRRQERRFDDLDAIEPHLRAIEAMGTEDRTGYTEMAAAITAELAAIEERQMARLDGTSPPDLSPTTAGDDLASALERSVAELSGILPWVEASDRLGVGGQEDYSNRAALLEDHIASLLDRLLTPIPSVSEELTAFKELGDKLDSAVAELSRILPWAETVESLGIGGQEDYLSRADALEAEIVSILGQLLVAAPAAEKPASVIPLFTPQEERVPLLFPDSYEMQIELNSVKQEALLNELDAIKLDLDAILQAGGDDAAGLKYIVDRATEINSELDMLSAQQNYLLELFSKSLAPAPLEPAQEPIPVAPVLPLFTSPETEPIPSFSLEDWLNRIREWEQPPAERQLPDYPRPFEPRENYDAEPPPIDPFDSFEDQLQLPPVLRDGIYAMQEGSANLLAAFDSGTVALQATFATSAVTLNEAISSGADSFGPAVAESFLAQAPAIGNAIGAAAAAQLRGVNLGVRQTASTIAPAPASDTGGTGPF